MRSAARIRASIAGRQNSAQFDFTFQRSVKKTVVEHLGQLDYVHARENVILLGPRAPARRTLRSPPRIRACLAASACSSRPRPSGSPAFQRPSDSAAWRPTSRLVRGRDRTSALERHRSPTGWSTSTGVAGPGDRTGRRSRRPPARTARSAGSARTAAGPGCRGCAGPRRRRAPEPRNANRHPQRLSAAAPAGAAAGSVVQASSATSGNLAAPHDGVATAARPFDNAAPLHGTGTVERAAQPRRDCRIAWKRR